MTTSYVEMPHHATVSQRAQLGSLLRQVLFTMPDAEREYVLGALRERRVPHAEGSLVLWGDFLLDAVIEASHR